MNVCLVSAAYRPYLSGVSEHVHNLARALAARGHGVHILTTNYGTGANGSPLTAHGLSQGTADSGPSAVSYQPPAITRLGRALVLPAHNGHFTLPVGLRLSGQVRRFLAAHRFDIVHCHGIFPPEIAYWAARHARSPVVATFHTVSPRTPGFVRAAFRALFPGLARRLRATIAVSNACARWARSWFPQSCTVIPNGIDTGCFSPAVRPRPELAAAPSILYVSRLDRRKGLPVLLRAMPAVLRAVPSARLFVIGSGPLEARCRGLCRELGIDRSVEFCGFVQPDELPACYTGCTVFCAPAQGPESMGIILLEAMACARPVVASRISGYDEVITDGRNGLLFPAGDSSALARALLAVLLSADQQSRLGSQALDDARQYSWPSIAGRVEEVYDAVRRQT